MISPIQSVKNNARYFDSATRLRLLRRLLETSRRCMPGLFAAFTFTHCYSGSVLPISENQHRYQHADDNSRHLSRAFNAKRLFGRQIVIVVGPKGHRLAPAYSYTIPRTLLLSRTSDCFLV